MYLIVLQHTPSLLDQAQTDEEGIGFRVGLGVILAAIEKAVVRAVVAAREHHHVARRHHRVLPQEGGRLPPDTDPGRLGAETDGACPG